MQSSLTQKSTVQLDAEAVTGQRNIASENHLSPLATVIQRTYTLWRHRLTHDQDFRNRHITHGALALVLLLVTGLSQVNLPWGKFNAIRPLRLEEAPAQPAADVVPVGAPLTLPAELPDSRVDVLVRRAVLGTASNNETETAASAVVAAVGPAIRSYAVETGDTITGIAEKFGLNPETLIWSNPELEYNPDLLSVGQTLTILPVNGVYHQVGGGDTIAGIAATFKTDPMLILNHPLNELDPDNPLIVPGEWLIVPGGSKPIKPRTVVAYAYDGPLPEDATLGTGLFSWPSTGSISQGFYSYHPGVDIAGWMGAPVLASDSGYVVAAGWDGTGYGLSVVVDHGNGFQTLYAHLQTAYVTPGESVTKGQQIAEMGSTGNSTGPHLHFELRQGTIQRNPYGFLP
jgi:murein DD-endopeptidase MepM/ murein hydrolase activator NlpD